MIPKKPYEPPENISCKKAPEFSLTKIPLVLRTIPEYTKIPPDKTNTKLLNALYKSEGSRWNTFIKLRYLPLLQAMELRDSEPAKYNKIVEEYFTACEDELRKYYLKLLKEARR